MADGETRSSEIAWIVEAAYEERASVWQSAQQQMVDWLGRQCRTVLDNGDQSRLSVHPGRIKDCSRAVDKLRRRVSSDPQTVVACRSDVEDLIRDLVGTKILCKSTRDQVLISEHLQSLCELGGHYSPLKVKDYLLEPKPSGYRAIHFEYSVPVAGEDPVLVELQVKTRLQDAWGELTHEDLYKPGSAIKTTSFHESVGRTMSNLLSEVDRLADDLATEMSTSLEPEIDDVAVSGTDQLVSSTNGTAPEVDVGDAEIDVTVRTTGPRYALAVDELGVQGLVRAHAVRALLGTTERIDVDDYLQRGDVVRARVEEDATGRFYVPLSLKKLESDGHEEAR